MVNTRAAPEIGAELAGPIPAFIFSLRQTRLGLRGRDFDGANGGTGIILRKYSLWLADGRELLVAEFAPRQRRAPGGVVSRQPAGAWTEVLASGMHLDVGAAALAEPCKQVGEGDAAPMR